MGHRQPAQYQNYSNGVDTNGQPYAGQPFGTSIGYNQEYNDKMATLAAAGKAANTPLQVNNPFLTQATDYFGGDPSLANAFMNPYLQNVVAPMQTQFNTQNQNAMQAAADQAQGAGAFGGNRAAIMQGTALSNNMNNQGLEMANLFNQGYGQAQGLASNAASNLMNAGEYNNQMVNANTMHPYQTMANAFNSVPEKTFSGGQSDPGKASFGEAFGGGIAQIANRFMTKGS